MCVWGGGEGGAGGLGAVFFPQEFLPIENQRISFFTVWEPKYFFQDKAKTKYFFLNSIYARNVFLQIYMFVYFLNPIHGYNIHGYIVHMFVLGPRM